MRISVWDLRSAGFTVLTGRFTLAIRPDSPCVAAGSRCDPDWFTVRTAWFTVRTGWFTVRTD
jgi:hypothetical protein